VARAIPHVRCLACGGQRRLKFFGLDENGEPADDGPPKHEFGYAIQQIGGNANCSWTYHDIPLSVAKAQLAAHLQAVERLRALIGEAEED
jgi:hypothetical protein